MKRQLITLILALVATLAGHPSYFSIVPSGLCLYFGILLINTAAKVVTFFQITKRPEALQEGVNAMNASLC